MAAKDLLEGVEPLEYAFKEYATKVRVKDATTGKLVTAKNADGTDQLTGDVTFGMSIPRLLTAGGVSIGRDIWSPPYRDVCLRIAATYLAAAAELEDAPARGNGSSSTAHSLTSEELKARMAAKAAPAAAVKI